MSSASRVFSFEQILPRISNLMTFRRPNCSICFGLISGADVMNRRTMAATLLLGSVLAVAHSVQGQKPSDTGLIRSGIQDFASTSSAMKRGGAIRYSFTKQLKEPSSGDWYGRQPRRSATNLRPADSVPARCFGTQGTSLL
jgi:hypothetical protein